MSMRMIQFVSCVATLSIQLLLVLIFLNRVESENYIAIRVIQAVL